jgi:hypothetical protein
MPRPLIYFPRIYLDDGDHRYADGQMAPGDVRCFVYFLQRGAGGPVKIGYSTNLKKRISKLQTGCAEKLDLLCALEGDRLQETSLHSQFQTERLHGEWFRPEKVLAYLVKEFGCDLTRPTP